MQSQWIEKSASDYEFAGILSREEVPELWATLQHWQPKSARVNISLSQVERVDSAGMAMLIHLIEHAKKQNCHIMLSFVPEQLLTLFDLSNLSTHVSKHLELRQG